jgi:hypothetical protein
MDRILICTGPSGGANISFTTYQKNNNPKTGDAVVEIFEPTIPSGKLTTPDLIAQYTAVVIKSRLKLMNDPVYSKIVVKLTIKGQAKEYEFKVNYSADK